MIEPEIKYMTLHYQFDCPECGEVMSAGFDSAEAYLHGRRFCNFHCSDCEKEYEGHASIDIQIREVVKNAPED